MDNTMNKAMIGNKLVEYKHIEYFKSHYSKVLQYVDNLYKTGNISKKELKAYVELYLIANNDIRFYGNLINYAKNTVFMHDEIIILCGRNKAYKNLSILGYEWDVKSNMWIYVKGEK